MERERRTDEPTGTYEKKIERQREGGVRDEERE